MDSLIFRIQPKSPILRVRITTIAQGRAETLYPLDELVLLAISDMLALLLGQLRPSIAVSHPLRITCRLLRVCGCSSRSSGCDSASHQAESLPEMVRDALAEGTSPFTLAIRDTERYPIPSASTT